MASISKRMLLSLLLLAPLLLGGCEEKRYEDWRDYNRLIVERNPATLSLLVQDDVVVRSNDMIRLQPFVDAYLQRGEAPFSVEVSKGEGDEGERTGLRRADQLVDLLNAMGVERSDLRVLTIAAGPTRPEGMAKLGYTLYAVKLPECGDWSDNTAFSPIRNDPSPSFGCSVTRNIGLMVDNPRDLIKPRALDGRDATRGSTIIGKYRAGEDTVSKGSVSSTISTIGASQ